MILIKPMDQNLLFSIIRQGEERSAKVCGIVCDLGNSKRLSKAAASLLRAKTLFHEPC